MTKITLNPAAEPATLAVTGPISVADTAGRKITLKQPDVLTEFMLVETLGDSSKNETFMRMVLPLIFVVDIDGDKIPTLQKKAQVYALIQRLGHHGVAAVMKGVAENFNDTSEEELEKNSGE